MHRLIHPLLLAVFLISYPLVTTQALADGLSAQLPDIGKAGTRVLSPREEQQLGQEFMRSVRHRLKLLDDIPTTAYLQDLADRLVSSLSLEEHQPITVFLVDDPSINAFAGPGGYIGIHTGLLLSAQREDELASVLAHEIAHVTQRHLVRAFQASERMSLPTMGALIAALILGANSPEVGEAVLATTLASNVQQQLTHSRGNEQEADNIGLEMLVNANFDPNAMVRFFEILMNKQRLTESSAPEFMRTHPLTVGRISDARNRAAQYPAHTPTTDTTFQLMRARTAAITRGSIPTAQISAFQKFQKRGNHIANRYYLALNAASEGKHAKARALLKALSKTNKHHVLFRYSAAQIELADNQPQQAHDILKPALTLFPGNLPLIELYAESLLRLGEIRAAFDLLKATLRKYPTQFRLYQTYARAASALGQNAEAYRALAEFQYAQGNLHQAVNYLEQALKTPGLTAYDRLSLQARQEMLKTEVKQRELSIMQEKNG